MSISGVLAWHPAVAMSPDEIDDFLSGRWVARIATNGPGGYPNVTPVWYYWDGRCLYFNIAQSRATLKNLSRDARCSVVIDMDERPLMGMRANMAKAVLVIGDADLRPAGSSQKVRFESGPYAGEHPVDEALGMINSRYGLTARDGAVGLTRESFRAMLQSDEIQDSQLRADNADRVLVKVVPKKIRAWDFSKAPIGYGAPPRAES